MELRKLRAAMDRVLTAIEGRHGQTVDLGADQYWTLDPRRTFDPAAEQASGLIIGELSDDVREMRDLVARDDEPVIWHDLAHIVGILGRVAALDLPDGGAA